MHLQAPGRERLGRLGDEREQRRVGRHRGSDEAGVAPQEVERHERPEPVSGRHGTGRVEVP